MSDWSRVPMGSLFAEPRDRKIPEASDGCYVGLEHIAPETARIARWAEPTAATSSSKVFRKNDVLFGRLRPYLKKVALADFDGVCSGEILVLRATKNVQPGFLYLLATNSTTIKHAVDVSAGSRMPRVSSKDLAALEVFLPPRPVQERIVGIVEAIDAQVSALKREADALDALLQGRKEHLFAQYAAAGAGLPIGEVLEEVKRPVTVDPEAEYTQIGIRSHGRGLFTKEAVTGESLGSKKIFRVEPGDLVINIVFAWEGAVAVVPPEIKGHCGSHRFPSYRRLDGGDIEFFRLFFSTKTGTQLLANCSPGGAGRNRTLNRKRLMQSLVGVPPVQEQERAVCELQAMEASVVAVRAETDRLRAVRTALLSALLDRAIDVESA